MIKNIIRFTIYSIVVTFFDNNLKAQGSDSLTHWIIGFQFSNVEVIPSLTTYTDGQPYITPKNIDRSFSTGLFLGVKTKREYTLKLRFDYTQKRLVGSGDTRENTASGGSSYDIDYFTFNSKIFSLVPEISWEFNNKRVGLSYGFVAPLQSYNSINLSHSKERSDNATNQVLLAEKTVITIPGGFEIGIGALVGVHYRMNKRFRIGIDYYPTFNYYSIGGKASSIYTSIGSINLDISETYMDKSQKTELNSKLNLLIFINFKNP